MIVRALAASLIGSLLLGPIVPTSEVCAAEAVRISVAVGARKIAPAQRTVRARQGDTIELAFTSDERVELHLHGYDRHLTVDPGSVAVMRIEAKFAGRFAIEAHRFGNETAARSRHLVLLYLEVHPR
jgi:hypothetical protein